MLAGAILPLTEPCGMTRSDAQLEASRQNGACSGGPASAEGKARSARNARAHGFRSAALCVVEGDDEARFRTLEESVQQRFAPRCAMEAAVCARITVALWRCERADRLETEYWNKGGRRVTPGHPMRMVQTIEGDQTVGTRSLATVLRYQADARNALAKALRDLEKLRSGRLDVADAGRPEPAGQPSTSRPSTSRPSNCTNEPEPPLAMPCLSAEPVRPSVPHPAEPPPVPRLNRHQRRQQAALRR
jgi:hypothetical protein